MTEIEKAVNKLDSAAEKMKGNYAKIIASHLIEQIRTEAAAAKFLDEEKTLEGCMNEIQSKARKQAVNAAQPSRMRWCTNGRRATSVWM